MEENGETTERKALYYKGLYNYAFVLGSQKYQP